MKYPGEFATSPVFTPLIGRMFARALTAIVAIIMTRLRTCKALVFVELINLTMVKFLINHLLLEKLDAEND